MSISAIDFVVNQASSWSGDLAMFSRI